jgi:hypothetical protein
MPGYQMILAKFPRKKIDLSPNIRNFLTDEVRGQLYLAYMQTNLLKRTPL